MISETKVDAAFRQPPYCQVTDVSGSLFLCRALLCLSGKSMTVCYFTRVNVSSKSFSQVVLSFDNSPLPIMVCPSLAIAQVKRCEKSGAFLHHFKILS